MRVRGSGCRFQVAGFRLAQYRLEDIRRVLIRKGYQLSPVRFWAMHGEDAFWC